MATSAQQSYVGQLDPNLNSQLLTAQQRLAIAQALQKQSMQPLQAPSGQNAFISPLSVLAQALMAYEAPKNIEAATQSLGDAQSKIAQYQMQDQTDWMNHTGRYAGPSPQQPPQQPPQDQPQQGQPDPQPSPQPSPQQGQQSSASMAQPTFPAASNQALASYLQTTGPSDPQSGAPQGQQPAPQQAGQSTVFNPMSAKNAMMAALLRGGSDAAGSPAAPPPSPPGASVPSTNGKGDAAPGQLGTGPTAGGVGFYPPSSTPSPTPSPSAFARVLGQNTGAAGGMPDPMSDPSIRYLSVGASRGYVPGEVAGKAVDNFYRMNDNRTDLEKQLISNGVQPGSPEWNQAHKDMLAKNTYLAPVPVAQGTTMIDPKTRQVIIQSPKLGEGMESDFSNPTNPSAHAVSGYAQGNAKNVGAARRAEQSNTVFTSVPGEGGTTLSGYGGSLFGGGGAGAPASGGPAGSGPSGAQVAPPGAQQSPASGNPPHSSGIIRGQSQTDKLLTDQGGQVYGRITAENTNNASHRQILNEMSALAQSGQFGPGTGAMARVRALAKNAGIDLSDAQTDQDVMKKLSANMVMSQLGQGGTGTNDQMSSIQGMFPNGEMTNDAMKKVIPLLYSQIDAREARSNVASQFLNNGGQLSQLPGYLSKYNAIADPGTVSLGKRMHEASANGTGKQLFNEIQAKYPKTWQSVLGRVQQLDQMGAF